MRSPVGDQTGPLAPAFTFDICRALAPLASAIQSWPRDTYATRFPSGDQRASLAEAVAFGNWPARKPELASPESFVIPPTGARMVTVVRLFASTFVVRREYSTQAPFGE